MDTVILFLNMLLPIVFLSIAHHLFKSSRTLHALPPGPRPLPIIGNLNSLGPLPHRDLQALFKTYGPIFYLRLGCNPTFFISSPSLAKDVLIDNDLSFPGRPLSECSKLISYGFKRFSLLDYGPYWRVARKLCISHLFGPTKPHYHHERLRKQEMDVLVASLREAAESRTSVDVTAKVDSFNADVVCQMVFGRKFTQIADGARFRDHTREMLKIYVSFNVSDYLPLLRFFDLQGFRRRVNALKGAIDGVLERVVDEHAKNRTKDEEKKDLVDILLDYMENQEAEFRIGHDHIKAIIEDMLEGGLETSPAAVDWALVELLRHPVVMKKLQEELESVVGLHRPVEESDMPKLTYLQMVVKESMRIHPLGPFLARRANQDCTIGGFNIPRKSDIMICIWSMFLDQEVWPEPDKFLPERFENNSIDVKGHDFELITFGAGRRICPAVNFALVSVSLVVAQLVHCFDWELPDGNAELNMEENFGLTMPRATHLIATPINRLCVGNVHD